MALKRLKSAKGFRAPCVAVQVQWHSDISLCVSKLDILCVLLSPGESSEPFRGAECSG